MAPHTLHRALLTTALAACGLALPLHSAHAQVLEFTGAELRGRIDRPSQENIWTFGDNNGNGTLDDDEHFGTRIDIDDVFLDMPGRLKAGPAASQPQTLQVNNRGALIGYRDYVGIDDDESHTIEIAIDLSDIYYFDYFRPSLTSNVYTQFSGAQLMQVLRFEGEPELTLTTAHETLELGYGARFLANPQYAQMNMGDFFGAMNIDSTVDNQALGPQLSARWSVRHGRWHARAEAAAALTYMNIDGDQSVQFGEEIFPLPRLNQPALIARNNAANHLSEWDVAPTLEAGVLASYDLTPSSLIFIRGDAIQFGNIRSVERAVVWQLPAMGLRDPGGQDVTITAASIGLEVRR